MSTYQISDLEKKLLSLIAKGESGGKDPYCSLYPGTHNDRLVSMTIEQVLNFQYEYGRIHGSNACGRYQFIYPTLKGIVQQANIDPVSNLFSPDMQDYLILLELKYYRGLEQWKNKKLGSTDKSNSEAFQLNLAKEFASIPVPYQTQGAHRIVEKGQSYYAGDGLNTAGHNPDIFLNNLIDIANGGPGNIQDVPFVSATSGTGNSALTQNEIAAGGGQRIHGGNPYDKPFPNENLPEVIDPYVYYIIDPLDDRYDFRTGHKVRNILFNGLNPQSNAGLTNNNGAPPINDDGSIPLTSTQTADATNGRSADNNGIITKTIKVYTPAGIKTLVKNYITKITPAGPQLVEIVKGANVSPTVQTVTNTSTSALDPATRQLATGTTSVGPTIQNAIVQSKSAVNSATQGLTNTVTQDATKAAHSLSTEFSNVTNEVSNAVGTIAGKLPGALNNAASNLKNTLTSGLTNIPAQNITAPGVQTKTPVAPQFITPTGNPQ